MSDIKSVASFFIGLVLFVLLVFFALGRLKAPLKPITNNSKITLTPTLVPSPTPVVVSKKLTLIERLRNIFAKKPKLSPTPTLTPVLPTAIVQQIKPTVILINETPQAGASATYIAGGAQNTYVIPETGSPTLLIPLSFLLGSAGLYLRKRK